VIQKRNALGFPSSWPTVARWCARNPVYVKSDPPAPKKFPGIPVLNNYKLVPKDCFWQFFPYRLLPATPSTSINVPVMKSFVLGMKGAVSDVVLKRGLKLVEDLSVGADAYQKTELPPYYNTEC
jgi:hypothetical protein